MSKDIEIVNATVEPKPADDKPGKTVNGIVRSSSISVDDKGHVRDNLDNIIAAGAGTWMETDGWLPFIKLNDKSFRGRRSECLNWLCSKKHFELAAKVTDEQAKELKKACGIPLAVVVLPRAYAEAGKDHVAMRDDVVALIRAEGSKPTWGPFLTALKKVTGEERSQSNRRSPVKMLEDEVTSFILRIGKPDVTIGEEDKSKVIAAVQKLLAACKITGVLLPPDPKPVVESTVVVES